MFYKVQHRVIVKDKTTSKPTFFAEIYEDEGAVVYYRSVLQAQIAADQFNSKNVAGLGELRVPMDYVIRPMTKEVYTKYLITYNSKEHYSITYMPRIRKYSELYGKASLYNLILSWKEYLEEVYV